jgi:transposase
LRLLTTEGKQHNVTVAGKLLEGFSASNILADKGYDSDTLQQKIIRQGYTPVIPSRSNSLSPAQYENHIYKERFVIECFFSKIKYLRRFFSRFDKTAVNYASFIALGPIIAIEAPGALLAEFIDKEKSGSL